MVKLYTTKTRMLICSDLNPSEYVTFIPPPQISTNGSDFFAHVLVWHWYTCHVFGLLYLRHLQNNLSDLNLITMKS